MKTELPPAQRLEVSQQPDQVWKVMIVVILNDCRSYYKLPQEGKKCKLSFTPAEESPQSARQPQLRSVAKASSLEIPGTEHQGKTPNQRQGHGCLERKRNREEIIVVIHSSSNDISEC